VEGTCAWAALRSMGAWVNATVAVNAAGGADALLLSATVELPPGAAVGSAAPTGSAYGWGAIPLSKSVQH
jgi:hypothetical protein